MAGPIIIKENCCYVDVGSQGRGQAGRLRGGCSVTAHAVAGRPGFVSSGNYLGNARGGCPEGRCYRVSGSVFMQGTWCPYLQLYIIPHLGRCDMILL